MAAESSAEYILLFSSRQGGEVGLISGASELLSLFFSRHEQSPT